MQIKNIQRKHKGNYLSLYHVTYEAGNTEHVQETVSRRGTYFDPEILSQENIGSKIDGVNCLIFNKQHDAICLIQEYRPSADTWICDIPMGIVEQNETPEQAAIRETTEETGLENIRVLNTLKPVFVNPSISDSKTITVILEAEGKPQFNETCIVPLWLEIKKIRKLLTHQNCPPMSARAQSVLYLLAVTNDFNFMIG